MRYDIDDKKIYMTTIYTEEEYEEVSNTPFSLSDFFYSLKGEGKWTGTPMTFIRLAGCNLNCVYCDTDYTQKMVWSLAEIITKVKELPTRRVVITGGEPTLQNIALLAEQLRTINCKVHLETNGTNFINLDNFDWVAVSPKSPIGTLDENMLRQANEVKFLIGRDWGEGYIAEVMKKFRLRLPFKYVMPLARAYPFSSHDGLQAENAQKAINFCLEHPSFSLCPQVHKIYGFK